MRIVYPYEKIAEEYNVDFETAEAYTRYLDKINNQNRRGGAKTYQDSMRSKTYKAERLAKINLRVHDIEIRNLTLEECQQIAHEVFYSQTWSKFENTKHSCKEVPEIKIKHMNSWAGMAYHKMIELSPDTGMNIFVLLHELAHTNGHRDHHQNFRAAQVAFTKKFMGARAGQILEAAYKEMKLKCTPYKAKEPKTFEMWHRGYVRMQNARASKA